MYKKILSLLLFSCFFAHENFAAKKRAASKEILSYQGGFFSYVHNNIRTVGNIYELTVFVNASDVTIDSVWFGATPVPCDVYETKTLQRVSPPVMRGKYLIKANRDLYANFYRNIDSSFAYNHFAAPFPFKGELVIMYSCKGKRYYKTIKAIEQREQKRMRE